MQRTEEIKEEHKTIGEKNLAAVIKEATKITYMSRSQEVNYNNDKNEPRYRDNSKNRKQEIIMM